jgi:hypothetical protein
VPGRRRTRVAAVESEFESSDLGDERLDRRLVDIATQIAAEPGASFPAAAGSDANLEATYRFLNNERVTPSEILAPHVRQTIRRARDAGAVVVAHDTTEFNFGRSAREDLGRVGQGKSFGFYGHFSLALSAGSREPLGIIDVRTHHRHGGKAKHSHRARQLVADNESRRWLDAVDAAERHLRPTVAAVHVMDREADSYALLTAFVERGVRFVVRMASPKRRLDGDLGETVGEALQRVEVLAERDVPITARGRSPMPSYRKNHPERNARTAKLQMTATRVVVLRPASSSLSPNRTLTMHAVRVVEPTPPAGEVPVEWRLWTTEPIDSAADVLAIVDAYRARWAIEEYFKALKTGCAFEQRQLESTAALLNALAIFAPIAWRLLLLRSLARDAGEVPATRVLTRTQLRCLTFALTKLRRTPLGARPTARDAMLGVAGLGGHIKNNGDPGWLVLGRGLEKLLTIELGYLAAGGAEL